MKPALSNQIFTIHNKLFILRYHITQSGQFALNFSQSQLKLQRENFEIIIFFERKKKKIQFICYH